MNFYSYFVNLFKLCAWMIFINVDFFVEKFQTFLKTTDFPQNNNNSFKQQNFRKSETFGNSTIILSWMNCSVFSTYVYSKRIFFKFYFQCYISTPQGQHSLKFSVTASKRSRKINQENSFPIFQINDPIKSCETIRRWFSVNTRPRCKNIGIKIV